MTRLTHTRTFAEMEVSAAVFEEVAAKLMDAGYDHAFVDGALDMHGIALTREETPMPEAHRELPRYRSHKVVHALKMQTVVAHPNGTGKFYPVEEGFPPIELSKSYMMKHAPQAGGYYVVYADGYESWSPAEAFEGGYTRID